MKKNLGGLLSDCQKIAIEKILSNDFDIDKVDNYYMTIIIDGLKFDIWISNGENWVAHSDNFRVQPFDLGDFDDKVKHELWATYTHRS